MDMCMSYNVAVYARDPEAERHTHAMRKLHCSMQTREVFQKFLPTLALKRLSLAQGRTSNLVLTSPAGIKLVNSSLALTSHKEHTLLWLYF